MGCYTESDTIWPNPGTTTRNFNGPVRPCMARVWHGMLLLAGGGTAGTPAPLNAVLYDPYTGAFNGSHQAGSFQSVNDVAIAYANLYTYLFFSDGTNLVYASTPQPPIDPNNGNQIQFMNFNFGATTPIAPVDPRGGAYGLATVIFSSRLYVFWQGGQKGVVSYTSAPLTGAANLSFVPVQVLGDLNPLSSIPATELSLTVFNNQIYCAYGDGGHYVRVITLAPANPQFMLSWTAVPTMTSDCGQLESETAPSIAADPKGTFLAMILPQMSTGVLSSTYLVPAPGQTSWTDPQVLSRNVTNVSPVLLTTAGNFGYILYVSTDGSTASLTTSTYLPSLGS